MPAHRVSRPMIICGAIALLLAIGVVFSASWQAGFVTWDDGLLVYENPVVQSLSWASIRAAFSQFDPELYAPLTTLSYQLDYTLGGLQPRIFHLHNVFLHSLNSLLLWWWLWLLTKRTWLSLAGSALFALHPVTAETVMWVSARKDVLAAAFALGCLIAYLRYCQTGKASYLYGSLGLMLGGLLAKIVVAGVLPVLLLIDWQFKRPLSRSVWREKLPFAAAVAILTAVAVLGKTDPLQQISLSEAILMGAKSTLVTVWHFVLPWGLSPIYQQLTPVTWRSFEFAGALIGAAILVTGAVIISRKHRVIAMSLGLMLCTLAPTFLSYARGGHLYVTADHYAYLPLVGFVTALAVAGATLLPPRPTAGAAWPFSVMSGLVIICAALTLFQSRIWTNSEALYRAALARQPGAYVAHNNLGLVLWREQGSVDAAEQSFHRAISLRPDYATPHRNLGMLYHSQSQLPRAEAAYHRSLALRPQQADVLFNLGVMASESGDIIQAEQYYLAAIAADPAQQDAYLNLGDVYYRLGKPQYELNVYLQALENDPEFSAAYHNLMIAMRGVE